MQRIAILLVCGFLFHPSVWAQQKSAAELREEAAEAEVHRQEIFLLERENAHALQIGNPSFIQRIYGEDFVGVSDQGQVLGKSDVIKNLRSDDIKYASVVVSDIRVRFFQKDTAVVQSLVSLRGTQRGRSFSRQRRIIHVYVNGARGWQMVASQGTLLPGEGQ
jgi:Domain of unknown function (DUF4440)